MEEKRIIPKKALGQNFLMHQKTADRIAEVGVTSPTETVLEIGPGTGMLTRALLARARHVVAIETDRELIPHLEETFAGQIEQKRFTLVEGDVRNFDTATLGTYTLVANIPYYITGEIIRTFLSAKNKPSSMTLLVQKEVAERIVRSKKESLLSLSVKAYGTPHYRFTVPRGAFIPAPNVDSAVLSVTDIHNPFITSEDEKMFFDVLHAGFAHKRKLLVRNLEVIAQKDRVQEAFRTLHIPEKARAEDISLTVWLSLARELKSNAHI